MIDKQKVITSIDVYQVMYKKKLYITNIKL